MTSTTTQRNGVNDAVARLTKFCQEAKDQGLNHQGVADVGIILEARLAAMQAPIVTDWQPIETAPKDGSRIFATNGDELVVMVYTIDFSWVHESYSPIVFTPTHWQPLPKPPIAAPENTHD